MTSKYRHRRTSNPGTAFPAKVEAGELVVNTANRKLAVGDADHASLGATKELLGVTIFDPKGNYAVGDLVIHNDGSQNTIWRCITAHNAAAWDGTHFEEAAGGKVIVSDNAPTKNLKDGILWFDSDTGYLYVYLDDGSSQQWVACITPAPPQTTPADEATAGILEVATQAETDAGTLDDRTVTPKKLKANIDSLRPFHVGHNYLINSDFAINQRKYKNGTALVYEAYCVDRWLNHNGSPGESMSFDGAGVATCTGTIAFAQRIEITPSMKAGDKFVLSWKGTAGGVIIIAGGNVTATSPQVFTLTAADITKGYFAVAFTAGTVSEPKLELGTEATPYEPPDPSTELARCMRYYQRNPRLYGEATGTGTVLINWVFAVPMRAKPSIRIINTPLSIEHSPFAAIKTAASPSFNGNIHPEKDGADFKISGFSGLTSGKISSLAPQQLELEKEL